MAAPTRMRNVKRQTPILRWKKLNNFWKQFCISEILTDFDSSWVVSRLLIVAEILLTLIVIQKIPYTEIDWKAYMQEVEGVFNGTFDYRYLKGDTGPLVYPAGFVYLFSLLHEITDNGVNIYAAQYIFAALYISTLWFVFSLYSKTKVVPPYALIFMCCTSYRIHSIYVLRLFNDPVAVFFLFLAVNCFVYHNWTLGCLIFSFAVSVKMNIMLFAPGLLYLLLSRSTLYETCVKIAMCAAVQVVLGLPFLIANPVSYIAGAFNLKRVFLYEWTVNWRLLPENIFLSPYFHASLLIFHIGVLLLFYCKWNKEFHSTFSLWPKRLNQEPTTDNILLVLFTSNFIGIMFCRSLHYQFYVWYFFTLPYLLWTTEFSPVFKLFILGILEMSWNTYPSTFISSLLMHVCHVFILVGLFRTNKLTTKEVEEDLKSR